MLKLFFLFSGPTKLPLVFTNTVGTPSNLKIPYKLLDWADPRPKVKILDGLSFSISLPLLK